MLTTEIVLPHKGEPEVLQRREVEQHTPGRGRVLIRMEAAGVAFAEVQMLRGRYPMQPKFPFVPGYDLVGTVIAIGDGVSTVAVGDRVAAMTRTGAWRTNVEVPAKSVVAVPKDVDAGAAVALIMNGVTAHQMAHRVVKVTRGQTVLVHGASGGVGTLLAQLAIRAGARVVGTASVAKHARLREIGVKPVDYRAADAYAQLADLGPYAAVFDHIGGSGLAASWRIVAPGGTLVSYGAVAHLHDEGNPLWPILGQAVKILRWNLAGLPHRKRVRAYYVTGGRKFVADLRSLFALLRAGELEPEIAGRYRLDEAPVALRRLVEHNATGKLVLHP